MELLYIWETGSETINVGQSGTDTDTTIPQLDGVAVPDLVREQDHEPVPQLRRPRRRYGSGKTWYPQWGQIDIDHPTLMSQVWYTSIYRH